MSQEEISRLKSKSWVTIPEASVLFEDEAMPSSRNSILRLLKFRYIEGQKLASLENPRKGNHSYRIRTSSIYAYIKSRTTRESASTEYDRAMVRTNRTIMKIRKIGGRSQSENSKEI